MVGASVLPQACTFAIGCRPLLDLVLRVAVRSPDGRGSAFIGRTEESPDTIG